MAGCSDNRYEKMLHAYELGMLSDEDRAAVEMHHLECDYCFEKAGKFNESARLIQCDSAVRETIHQIAEADKSDQTDDGSLDKKSSWPIWLRTSIAAAAVLIILVLQPWKIEISPKQELFAAENLLAIMHFGNMADKDDSQRFGEIVANLIITDLSESLGLQIVSNQRLFDITKRLGLDDGKVIDNDMVLQIANEANAQWVVTGDILQTDPVFVVTSQVIDITTGNIIKTQKISGETGTTIFSLADSLSILIKNDLPIESKLLYDTDRNVADVTTHSPEAYRCYLEGVDYNNRAYYAEAVERFEKVLEYDSTFAMAYYYLSNLKDFKLIEKAVEYADNTTQMERFYINARQAVRSGDADRAYAILNELLNHYPHEKQAYYLIGRYEYSLGQYENAIDNLNRSVELDPLFIAGYNMLSYSYANMDKLDKALEMNDKFISLSPNEPNPYDTRGDIYAKFKMYDKAIESFKKALEKKNDFHSSWSNLGNLYTYTGDFVRAESCFQVIASVEDIYIWTNGKVLLGQNLIYQGKFAEALTMFEIGSNEDKKAHGEQYYPTYHHLPALIYDELGDFDKALDELEKADVITKRRNGNYNIYWRKYHTRIVANSGDITLAQNIADSLKAGLEEAGLSLGDYWYAAGSIDMARKNFAKAENYFRKAIAETDSYDYSANYMLGLALFNMDRLNESIKVFGELLAAQNSNPKEWSFWDSRVYYYLGLAYEKSGNIEMAVKNYKIYLDIRKDADSKLETVNDARKRLNSLVS